MPLYDFVCPECGYSEVDILTSAESLRLCSFCGTPMGRSFPLPARHMLTKGRSAESQQTFMQKQTEILTKRSNDYDKSPAGKYERGKVLERLEKKGTIAPGSEGRY